MKMQTGQQIKAGIEREYIEQADAVKVSKEIERIIEHYVTYSKIFSVAKVVGRTQIHTGNAGRGNPAPHSRSGLGA